MRKDKMSMSGGLEIVTVAEATEEHPRQSEGTLVEIEGGRTMLAWQEFWKSRYQGGDEAPSNICSMVSFDGCRTWGDYRVLVKMDPTDTNLYCPGLLRLKSGEILLKYERYHLYRQGTYPVASGYACKSSDEGKTFSEPVTIWSKTNHGGAAGDVKQLTDGRIIVPTVKVLGKTLDNDQASISPTNHIVAGCHYSDDNGETWKDCKTYVDLPLRGCMEPKIEELKDGRLLMVMRTQLGAVFQSVSADGGESWAEAERTCLQAPESCPELIRIPQTGDLLIVWNNSTYNQNFDHYGLRTPLTVAVSSDEGGSWRNFRNIQTEPDWEFTNPAAIATSRDTVVLTYMASKYQDIVPPGRVGRSRMSLKLAIIDIDWLYE